MISLKYKILLLLLLGLTLFSCESDEFIGHWHIDLNHVYVDPAYRVSKEYLALNVIVNSKLLLDTYSIHGTSYGRLNKHKKEIDFIGHYGLNQFSYSIHKTTISLKEKEGDLKLTGYQCGLDCCDLVKDFFNGSNVQVNLSMISEKNKEKKIQLLPSFGNNIFIGKPKDSLGGHPIFKDKILLDKKFATLDDLNIWLEKKRVKNQNQFPIVIYTDVKKNASLISEILNVLPADEDHQILIAFLDDQVNAQVPISLVDIKYLNLDKEK